MSAGFLLDLETIRADREALRRRWVAEGWYGGDTLRDALRRGAERHPDVPMVFHSQTRPAEIRVGEVRRRSCALANALAALGLGRGDVVAVQLPSWLDTVLAYHAVFELGGVVLPVAPGCGPAELRFMLRQSRARALVQPRAWRSADYAAQFPRLGELPELAHWILIGDSLPAGARDWDALLRARAPERATARIDPDEPCILLYTSGTTATPKGVVHTHHTFLAEIGPRGDVFGAGPGDVELNVWPAGHLVGLMSFTRPFLAGERTVFLERWDPDAAAGLIEKHRVTRSSGTPIFLRTLLEAAQRGGRDLSSLRVFGLGGAGISPGQIRWAEERGFAGARSYGSTEHPSITRSPLEAPFAKRACTDGRLSGANEVRIVNEAGRDVPLGGEGEIVSRGPELFVGYLDPELDRESFLPGGWFRTGDVGRLDAEGYLTVTDRLKDIVNRGGEKISSKEVEDVLARHPRVREAAVVALPDETYGEKLCAFVILEAGAGLDLEEVAAHFARAGVARHKTPERLVVVDDLPRTPAGKVKKFELRSW